MQHSFHRYILQQRSIRISQWRHNQRDMQGTSFGIISSVTSLGFTRLQDLFQSRRIKHFERKWISWPQQHSQIAQGSIWWETLWSNQTRRFSGFSIKELPQRCKDGRRHKCHHGESCWFTATAPFCVDLWNAYQFDSPHSRLLCFWCWSKEIHWFLVHFLVGTYKRYRKRSVP